MDGSWDPYSVSTGEARGNTYWTRPCWLQVVWKRQAGRPGVSFGDSRIYLIRAQNIVGGVPEVIGMKMFHHHIATVPWSSTVPDKLIDGADILEVRQS